MLQWWSHPRTTSKRTKTVTRLQEIGVAPMVYGDTDPSYWNLQPMKRLLFEMYGDADPSHWSSKPKMRMFQKMHGDADPSYLNPSSRARRDKGDPRVRGYTEPCTGSGAEAPLPLRNSRAVVQIIRNLLLGSPKCSYSIHAERRSTHHLCVIKPCSQGAHRGP
jgi:hypothetical protein